MHSGRVVVAGDSVVVVDAEVVLVSVDVVVLVELLVLVAGRGQYFGCTQNPFGWRFRPL